MKTNTRLYLSLILVIFINASNISMGQNSNQKNLKVLVKTRSKEEGGRIKYADYKEFETRTIDLLDGFKPDVSVKFTKYGSNPNLKSKATGFFRLEKIKDRWWVIDPEGFAGMHIAVNSLTQGRSDRNVRAFTSKYGTEEKWISETNSKLHELGFNGTGSWSDHEVIILNPSQKNQPLAYCINWNFMSSYGKKRGGTFQQPGHTGYPKNAIFVFDNEFVSFCDEHAKKLIAYKDDPNLFGYFSDNEMPFPENALMNYLSLPANDQGRIAANKWLKDKGLDSSKITSEIKDQFRAFVGESYFRIVSAAIKKYDPNHLFLGSRLYSNEKQNEAFMRAAGKYIDILSCNYYGQWTPNPKHLKEWADWTGRPFLITEWYVKAEDAGLANISGAGWIVKTQNERGLFYQNYALGLLESKSSVGWHWFKYQDNDPTTKGVDPSNTDANKGIVDNDYNFYEPLIKSMKQLNINRFKLIEYFDNK